MHIVLLEPEIPQNAGNIARTCVVAGACLHFIRPLGFQLTEKKIKRSAMDYFNDANVIIHESFESFLLAETPACLWMATTKAKRTYTQVRFEPDSYILFGKESAGIPETLLLDHEETTIRIPMKPNKRSLNLACSVSIILYEALRQNSFSDLIQEGALHYHNWTQ